jgi:hypothetical protein
MPENRSKRPRDPNQWAKRMVDLATMDEAELAKLREKQFKRGKAKKSHTPGKRGSAK